MLATFCVVVIQFSSLWSVEALRLKTQSDESGFEAMGKSYVVKNASRSVFKVALAYE